MLSLLKLLFTNRLVKAHVHVYYAETCIGKSFARHEILKKLPHSRRVREAIAILDHDFLHLKHHPVQLLRYLFDVVKLANRHVFFFTNSVKFLRLAAFIGCDIRFIATYPGDPKGYGLLQERWARRHEGSVCGIPYDAFSSHSSSVLTVADELNEDRIIPNITVPFVVGTDEMANTASNLMIDDVLAFITTNLGE